MIYIVEDDVSILGLEEYALQNSGFETRGFSDGESFLKACDQQIPQMAVLDVMLPGDDGIAILGEIRSDERLLLLAVIQRRADLTDAHRVKVAPRFGAQMLLILRILVHCNRLLMTGFPGIRRISGTRLTKTGNVVQ